MECRAAPAFLRIEDVTDKQAQRQQQKIASYDPLNPEHEATGQVSWVNSTICGICHDFPLGGFDP
jgi:hypothetical protein